MIIFALMTISYACERPIFTAEATTGRVGSGRCYRPHLVQLNLFKEHSGQ